VGCQGDPATLAAMGCDPGMPVLAARLTHGALRRARGTLPGLLGSAGSIALGLTYVLHAFGPTEAEVVLWGRVSIYLGLAVVPLTVGAWRSHSRIIQGVAGLGWGIVALLQVPPVLLWFAFHGSGISDGTPPSTFVAHWAYSIPHLALLAASAVMVRTLLARRTCRSRTRKPSSCEPKASTSRWDSGNT